MLLFFDFQPEHRAGTEENTDHRDKMLMVVTKISSEILNNYKEIFPLTHNPAVKLYVNDPQV